MGIRSRLILFFLAGIWLTSFVVKQQGESWVYEREKQGIKVFTKKSKWGKLRDAKAEMLVSATPEQVLNTLMDFDNYKTWMPSCAKSRLLARLNENEYIAYLYFDAPWPVRDRDCVMRVKIERDRTYGTIKVTETSEPKYIHEQSDVVRVEQLVSRWTLMPKQGSGTIVVNEYSSNPGGNIPDWMTNTQSVTNPLETFENLQQKVAKRK